MPEGAAEPIEFPDDQGVAGTAVKHLLEGGPVGAGAAGGLGEHPVAAGVLEGVDLELGVLVGGGDAGIAELMSHAVTVSQPSDSGGCATLISDTGSGHLLVAPRRERAAVAETGGLRGSAQHVRQGPVRVSESRGFVEGGR